MPNTVQTPARRDESEDIACWFAVLENVENDVDGRASGKEVVRGYCVGCVVGLITEGTEESCRGECCWFCVYPRKNNQACYLTNYPS
jgi:hypothetical protein